MTASYCKRLVSFVPVLGALTMLSGCPEPLELGEVRPPPPPPDFSVEVDFSFEASEMPAATDGSFTIGEHPITAKFNGGEVTTPTNGDLVRSGSQAWLIDENGTGTIEFTSPARHVEFFFRNELDPPVSDAPPAKRGGRVQCGAPDPGLSGSEDFGLEMFARGGFNGWGADATTRFVNQGGGVYVAEFEMEPSPGYGFKIASEDWTIEYSNPDEQVIVGTPQQIMPAEAGSANDTVVIDETDCYTWTITVLDDSALPAPLIELLVTPKVEGPAGAAGSEIRFYDTYNEVIATVSGLSTFIRVEQTRDPTGRDSDPDNDTLISRIEIDNMGTSPAVLAELAEREKADATRETCGVMDQGNDDTAAFGSVMHARGGFNDWGIGAPQNFVNFGGGNYQAEFDMITGAYEFKIANEAWSTEYSSGAAVTLGAATAMDVNPGLANSSVDIPADGCYTWNLNVVDDSAIPAPAVELTVAPKSDGGPTGETGIGFVSIDDFEFRADRALNRSIAIVYLRPDGDYSETQIQVSGDIVGGAQTLTCDPLQGRGVACVAVVRLMPGGSLTYTVLNGGVPDDGGEITLRAGDITPDNVVLNFAGSSVPVTRDIPVAPAENEVILFYKRSDNNYEGWGLHLFPEGSEDWTVFTGGEYPYAGIDPVLGAYFVIALPGSPRLTAPYSNDPAPLTTFPETLGFIIHNGDNKDPGPDQFVRIAEDGQIIFVRSGVASVSTTPPVDGGVTLTGAEAHWVKADTLLWNHPSSVAAVRLLYSADGRIREAGGRLVGIDMSFDLVPGTSPDLPNALHIQGDTPYSLPGEAIDMAAELVKGQLLAVGVDDSGAEVEATSVQIPLVLDDLYAEAAADATLGVSYAGSAPSVAVWAPTSNSVTLNLYDSAAADVPAETLPMSFDPATGIWSIAGSASWDRQWYTFTVNNFAPTAGRVLDNEVTDPYSVNLSMDSGDRLVKSQFVNLDDADLKPAEWDTFSKPALAAPEDIVIYELHLRDFSALDGTVMPDDQGKYTAFAGDGAGSMHLRALAEAGLTHVHLLPAFDIATVNEDASQRVDIDQPIEDLCAVQPAAASLCSDFAGSTIREVMAGFGPTDAMQSQIAEWLRGIDSFNWGYDPYHFNTPEGSYSSDPDGTARVLEFRTMVKGLSDLGLRTIMDQVYNHTNASGHFSDKSVLDKIVPGYYHRRDDTTGGVLRETCCDDTAAEHAMFGKFIVDSAVQWVTAYKVDGFRFDLMAFHPLSMMEELGDRLAALTPASDGVDGASLYIYGEGWNTGIAAGDSRFVAARQDNLAGTGLGSFNDRIRDAVRGGGPFDSGTGHIDNQGFISGQYYDPNANNSGSADELNALLRATDRIRAALAGALDAYPMIDSSDDSETTAGALGAGYTDDPQEIVNYVASHDGETLWDISQFKHPTTTSTTDRVRAHNIGNALVLLGQGVAFLQAGQDLLRSKSMDRNSFDSGDWFNYLDFTGMDDNFAVGLPLSGDNSASLTEIADILGLAVADPGPADIALAADVTQEWLRIRRSTQLFRLRNGADVVNRVAFHNTGSSQVPGMIVMSIDGCVEPSYTPEFGNVVVVFNARTDEQVIDLFGASTFSLHPVQADAMSADAVVRTAFHDASGFHVPARTTAVFTQEQTGAACGFGAAWDDDTAFVSGEFNGDAFVNALLPVGNTGFVEGSLTLPVGMNQLYRVQSADTATINCGGPTGGGTLFTPITPLMAIAPMASTLECGSSPEDLALDVPAEGRYRFSIDRNDPINPSLVIRPQTGNGFPIEGSGGCGIADPGNDNTAEFGSQMFVRGSFTGWEALPDYQLYNMGDGSFSAEFEIMTGEQAFKIANADWSAPEYGDPPDPMTLGVTQTVGRASGPGTDILLTTAETACYNFVVDPSDALFVDDGLPETIDLTVTLKPVATGEPTATPLVRGSFNGWSNLDEMEMIGATTFEGVVPIGASGTHTFRIASDDELIVNCGGPQDLAGTMDIVTGAATTISCSESASDLSIDIATAGEYAFTLETANRANPTLTVRAFTGSGFSSAGTGEPPVYVKGDFNLYGLDNVMTDRAGRTYTEDIDLAAGTHSFRFESEDGVVINCGTPRGEDAAVIISAPRIISCGEGFDDLSLEVTGGRYRFFLQPGAPYSGRAPQLTVSDITP